MEKGPPEKRVGPFAFWGGGGGASPGVAGAATERPLEGVESNRVRTRGILPPKKFLSKKHDPIDNRHFRNYIIVNKCSNKQQLKFRFFSL
jgi:hypothetical protein